TCLRCWASTSFLRSDIKDVDGRGQPRAEGENQETNVGRVQSHRRRRNLGPLRWLADRRGLLLGGDLRLGPRLLWPKRLSRRIASPARLAGLADCIRDDLLLFVRRRHGGFCQRGGAGVRSAQLPARRY